MVEISAEQFVQRAFELNLLDQRQLNSVWSELRSRNASIGDVRTVMMRRDILTNYQVERLSRGERGGFFYGHYKVLYLVGTGSFARVYRAVHTETDKVVAVKVLRSRYSSDAMQTGQFLREGQLGVSLRHPNIVPTYEVRSQRSVHYLVMDFVEGQSLRDFVKVRKKLDVDMSTRLISDVAAGLGYAFEKGVTHRDVKLSNVLISSRGRAKMVDFGLAAGADKLTDDALAKYPNPRTIDYVGLERATGVRKDDPRSDIYFVGCAYYHMLTGRAPLSETKDRVARLSINRFREVPPIAQLEPTLPKQVVAIVSRAMELDPQRRFESPGAMLEALKEMAKTLAEKTPADDSPAEAEPSKGAPAGATAASGAASESATTAPTLLIVESNASIQKAIHQRLTNQGYRVLVSADPAQAIERFHDQKRLADCVVFSCKDLGAASLEAFNRFGTDEATKHLPAILLLGERQQAWKKKAQLADHRVALSMPIRLKQFLAVLGKLLSATLNTSS